MYVLIHSICFSLSDFFHSIWPFLGPSMYLQIAPFRSFSRLSSIPLCICTTASLPIPLLRNVFCLFFNLRLVALALRAVNRQKLERLSRDVWWKPDGQEQEHREKILSSSCSDGKWLHWELQWYNIENIPNEMVHLTIEISWLRILSVHVFLLGVLTRYLQRLKREREKGTKEKLFLFYLKAFLGNFFLQQFEVLSKIERKVQRYPIHSLPLHMHSPPHYQHSPPEGYIFYIDEPPSTHHYPKVHSVHQGPLLVLCIL